MKFKEKDRVKAQHILFKGKKHGGMVVHVDTSSGDTAEDPAYLVVFNKGCVGDYGHNGAPHVPLEKRAWIIGAFGVHCCLWVSEANLEKL